MKKIASPLLAAVILAAPLASLAVTSESGVISVAQEEATSRHPLGFKAPERQLLRGYLKESGGTAAEDLSRREKEKLRPGETLPREMLEKGEPLPEDVRSRLNNTTAGVTEMQFDNRLVRLWEASRQIIDVVRSPRGNGS